MRRFDDFVRVADAGHFRPGPTRVMSPLIVRAAAIALASTASLAVIASPAWAQDLPEPTIDCDQLREWNSRLSSASSSDTSEAAEALLAAFGRGDGAVEARALMTEIYVCYVQVAPNNEQYDVRALETLLGNYAHLLTPHPAPSDVLDQWRADFEMWTRAVESVSGFNSRTFALLGTAESFATRWTMIPIELAEQQEHVALKTAIKAKTTEIASARAAEEAATSQTQFNANIADAMAKYGETVAAMGFDDAYLDSSIILEGYNNPRWITFREWLAALHHSGHFESIEASQLPLFDAYGIVTKRPGRRQRGWYFVQEGNDLFLTYVGESNQIYRMFDHETDQFAQFLQEMIR